jgi:ubiquinone/menaquinone biosynthesis C-methylase UbiE
MDFGQVKEYWEQRATGDSSAQSTTQDFYLRDIEYRVIRKLIESHNPKSVMDVGCGDARTTARLAADFNNITFSGGDYSSAMVKNAGDNIDDMGIKNMNVVVCDVLQSLPAQPQAMIYTTRCLINLPDWKMQQAAINNIGNALETGGIYVMIENFIEGHEKFNKVRQDFGLPEIKVRSHNLFFERQKLLDFVSDTFEVIEEVNISSSYYLASRALYSRICQDEGEIPDYFDVHHQYASRLPFCGEYGPVRMICLRRR